MKLENIVNLNTDSSLDSHKGECAASRLAANFRETLTLEGQTCPAISSKVYYPRIKKLNNGKYILLHMDYRLGGNIFYSLSDDCRNFSPRAKLFAAREAVRDDGEPDRLMFATPDAAVLPNGDLIVVCSFRYGKGYGLDSKYGGLVMKRSTDNGLTFSEEKKIYTGRNWEPYILVLRSGEIQIYFSHTAPKFYLDKTVRTDSPIKTSSGSAIIRSYDNGDTWTPSVTDAPYAAWRVTQSYIATMENGTKCFTNQMATAVELGDCSIAVSTESDLGANTFRLTVSYSHDNWAKELGIDEDGPSDKDFAFDEGAGPYIAHFRGGETALSYNWKGFQHIRVGDENARNFDKEHEIITFGGRWGYWGSLTVENPHCMICAYPNISEIRNEDGLHIDNDLMICKYYLNHRIDSKPLTQGWVDNTDALFLGALSQAQCAFRTAYDSDKVYFRADRSDRFMTAADSAEILVRIGEDTYKLGQNLSGKAWFEKNDTPTDFGAAATFEAYGNMNEWGGDENGAVLIFSMPKTLFGNQNFEISAVMKNSDGLDLVTEKLGDFFPVKFR